MGEEHGVEFMAVFTGCGYQKQTGHTTSKVQCFLIKADPESNNPVFRQFKIRSVQEAETCWEPDKHGILMI